MAEKKIEIRQIRSTIRRNKKQLRTLQSLGLGKIGRKHEHRVCPEIEGMVRRVSHLVTVREL